MMNMEFKTFTESEVYETYIKYVKKTDDYYTKNETLPLPLDELVKWNNRDFPRLMSILDFKEWIPKYIKEPVEKLLVTDTSDVELPFLPAKKIYNASYHNGQNDLHTLNLEIKDFDFILFNQTIEHLYNPFICMKNIHNHLTTGGFVYTTMPTINIPHMVPFHFNGYTPTGLCMLMKSVGFEVLEVGYWGNRDYINYIFEKQDWPDWKTLQKDGKILNERNCEVQCWILARKT